MKLGYERLAIAGLSAMITTLLITTARYATERQNRFVDHKHPVPTYRRNQTNASIIHALTTGP